MAYLCKFKFIKVACSSDPFKFSRWMSASFRAIWDWSNLFSKLFIFSYEVISFILDDSFWNDKFSIIEIYILWKVVYTLNLKVSKFRRAISFSYFENKFK